MEVFVPCPYVPFYFRGRPIQPDLKVLLDELLESAGMDVRQSLSLSKSKMNNYRSSLTDEEVIALYPRRSITSISAKFVRLIPVFPFHAGGNADIGQTIRCLRERLSNIVHGKDSSKVVIYFESEEEKRRFDGLRVRPRRNWTQRYNGGFSFLLPLYDPQKTRDLQRQLSEFMEITNAEFGERYASCPPSFVPSL
jgi:hypothetical protein